MDVSGAIMTTIKDVAAVVEDITTKAAPEKLTADVCKVAVDVIHDVTICCGLYRSTHKTTPA
ncbi:hypothetical protein EBZ38_08260 [bacterium]|nr:hypothetical protein [Betaproteobacteria bacterium]NDC95194.1 hypothetical protein [bacterium]NDD84248.1 hypothetical protein [bacterium]NDG19394.1 hypothetical protein [Betaproteobacteria bacterium]